ncbi:MAG: efflux RND transporter periplasmic adaptor subunit, partial [Campylobacterales bacterium]|nr:efflux RND transporter periplasmic adaptor subunit [Campylobacterales bacterium]
NSERPKQRDANATKKERRQRTATVYILENGLPKPVKVELGITDNKLTEIVGGELKEGDSVITDEAKEGKNSNNKPPMRMF